MIHHRIHVQNNYTVEICIDLVQFCIETERPTTIMYCKILITMVQNIFCESGINFILVLIDQILKLMSVLKEMEDAGKTEMLM